ncbi:Holliday junction resolvase RuvX [Defluviicoccus vanus]
MRQGRQMPVIAIAEFRSHLRRGERAIGLDLGTRTIGLALSDLTLTVATPRETLRRVRLRADLDLLLARLAEWEVGGVVIGLPVSMNGQEGPRCQATRQFGRDLLARADLPLAYWDERLSTAAVERMLIDEVDMSRRRRREVVDKTAAAYILQGALDAMAIAASRQPPR